MGPNPITNPNTNRTTQEPNTDTHRRTTLPPGGACRFWFRFERSLICFSGFRAHVAAGACSLAAAGEHAFGELGFMFRGAGEHAFYEHAFYEHAFYEHARDAANEHAF
jgi:hypothetical protein